MRLVPLWRLVYLEMVRRSLCLLLIPHEVPPDFISVLQAEDQRLTRTLALWLLLGGKRDHSTLQRVLVVILKGFLLVERLPCLLVVIGEGVFGLGCIGAH